MLGVAFAVPFPGYFQKLQLLVVKNFEIFFVALYVYLFELKNFVSNYVQTGDIDIFVLHGVVFSRYVILKSSFSDELKHQRRSYRKLTWQSIKGKFHYWQKWSSGKLFIM